MALLLGVSGIFLIVGPSSAGMMTIWSLLAMLSPLAFAVCSIFIARYQPKTMSSLQAANGMLFAASLILTPLVLQQHAFFPLNPPYDLAKQVVLLEVVLSTMGYLVFFMLIRMAGPVFYSLTGGIVAITGLFWGYMIFAEKPSAIQAIAISCVITAIFLLSWRQAKQQG